LDKAALLKTCKGLWFGGLDVLWPSRCPGCGAAAGAETLLCPECINALAGSLTEHRCPKCGSLRNPVLRMRGRCQLCRRDPLAFDRAVAGGDWTPPMSTLICALKFNGRKHVARPIARFMSAAAVREGVGPDAVVPVPLHWTARVKRRFNQAELLAAFVASRLKRPLVKALKRVRRTPSQRNYSRTGRFENVRGAFAPNRRARSLAKRSVLLVDDVMTTGATASECARTLKRAGVREVVVLVAARSQLSIRQLYKT